MIFYPWQLIVLGVTIVTLFGLIGSYDYDEELASQSLYCNMTTEGSWPLFNSAIDCSYQDDKGR